MHIQLELKVVGKPARIPTVTRLMRARRSVAKRRAQLKPAEKKAIAERTKELLKGNQC